MRLRLPPADVPRFEYPLVRLAAGGCYPYSSAGENFRNPRGVGMHGGLLAGFQMKIDHAHLVIINHQGVRSRRDLYGILREHRLASESNERHECNEQQTISIVHANHPS